MRRLFYASTILVASAVAGLAMLTTSAQARVNTNNLSCAQAKNLVRSSRAVVLSTGRYTYDRYVANAGYCDYGQFIKRAYVPTRDRKSCLIGYICTRESPWIFMTPLRRRLN